MKKLLILILLICTAYTSFAKIDTVYTQQNGVVTIQILETPDKILEAFKNTTPYTFTEQEIKTLMSGVTIKKPLGVKMETLFPPRFGNVAKAVFLKDGTIQQTRWSSSIEISWRYLIFNMIVPAILILVVSLFVPQEDNVSHFLFGFYGAMVIPTIVIQEQTSEPVGVGIGSAGLVLVFYWFMRGMTMDNSDTDDEFDVLLFCIMVIITVIISSFVSYGASDTSSNSTLVMQYQSFIAGVCVISYGVRQFVLE